MCKNNIFMKYWNNFVVQQTIFSLNTASFICNLHFWLLLKLIQKLFVTISVLDD